MATIRFVIDSDKLNRWSEDIDELYKQHIRATGCKVEGGKCGSLGVEMLSDLSYLIEEAKRGLAEHTITVSTQKGLEVA